MESTLQFLGRYEHLLAFLGILLATILASYLFNRIFRRFIRNNSLIMRTDPTNYQFLRHVITAVIYGVGLSLAIYSVPELRTVANSILAGAGILAVAVGFASQAALSNIISGMFIVLFKPFRVNDRLQLTNQMSGVVEDISLRHTVIRDFENRRIIIPNTVISNEIITNADFADDGICRFFPLSIGFDTDLERVMAIIREEVADHPNLLDKRSPEEIAAGEHPVRIRVLAFGEYTVNLRAYLWAEDNAKAFAMSCDLYEALKKRFDREGIRLPVPNRRIVPEQT